jgi:hypothetical protein
VVDYSTPLLRLEGLAVVWGVALREASLVSEEQEERPREDCLEIDRVGGCLETLAVVEVWGEREEEGGCLDRTRRLRPEGGCLLLAAVGGWGEVLEAASFKHQCLRVRRKSLHCDSALDSEIT